MTNPAFKLIIGAFLARSVRGIPVRLLFRSPSQASNPTVFCCR
jgi:hypothetical protein